MIRQVVFSSVSGIKVIIESRSMSVANQKNECRFGINIVASLLTE